MGPGQCQEGPILIGRIALLPGYGKLHTKDILGTGLPNNKRRFTLGERARKTLTEIGGGQGP